MFDRRLVINFDWVLLLTVCVLAGIGIVFGFFVNLNYFGLGRMYRDRIIETFLPNRETVEKGRWALATEANREKLHDVCTEEDQGPYHLVNCNVVLVDSPVSKYRGRGGDNFILSSRYCGSDATSWVETGRFNHGFQREGNTDIPIAEFQPVTK